MDHFNVVLLTLVVFLPAAESPTNASVDPLIPGYDTEIFRYGFPVFTRGMILGLLLVTVKLSEPVPVAVTGTTSISKP